MKLIKDEKGFSLLEVTVSLMVLTVVLGIAFALLNGFQQTYRYEEGYADAQRNGRFAIARLNEIIRSAGNWPGGTYAVNGANFVEFPNGNGGSSIRLKSDLNGDRVFTTSISSNSDVIVTSEDVTIRLTGNALEMVDNTGTAPPDRAVLTIADNIRNITFSDPDVNNSRREVVVNLVATPNGIASNDPRFREVNYVSSIRLRNR